MGPTYQKRSAADIIPKNIQFFSPYSVERA